jgi:hypothetical protein
MACHNGFDPHEFSDWSSIGGSRSWLNCQRGAIGHLIIHKALREGRTLSLTLLGLKGLQAGQEQLIISHSGASGRAQRASAGQMASSQVEVGHQGGPMYLAEADWARNIEDGLSRAAMSMVPIRPSLDGLLGGRSPCRFLRSL